MTQTDTEYTRLIEKLENDGSSWAQDLFNQAAQALRTLQQKLDRLTAFVEQTETPESRAGGGVVRYDAHMAALTAAENLRDEEIASLQQKNKELEGVVVAKDGAAKAYYLNWREAESQVETLKTDLERKDKALKEIVATFVKPITDRQLAITVERIAAAALSPAKDEGR